MKSKLLQTLISLFLGWWFLLFILSFSFNFNIIPDIGGWFSIFFEFLASLTQGLFIQSEYVPYVSAEDSMSLYFNLLNIFFIAIVLTWVSFKLLPLRKVLFLIDSLKVIIRYYVILILMFYGFDKIYKMQFSLPEPNIEYTRIKDLHTDILFWTTMGKSYSYSLITGIMEVAAGALLLFYKTRLLGVLMSIVVFMQVFLINIGFDVTMKLFSFMLLLMSLFLLLPYLKMLNKIFFSTVSTAIVIPSFQSNLSWFGFKKYIKVLVVLLMVSEGNYKAFSTSNFNDDIMKRPYANGAYEVDSYLINGIEIQDQRWSKFFIHRDGYFIIELQDETKQDYKMEFIKGTTTMKLTDYNFNDNFIDFVKSDSLVNICIALGGDTLRIKAHQLSY